MRGNLSAGRLRLGWWLCFWMTALVLIFIPTDIAYAHDCEVEPWNLADCLRTPGYREWYITTMIALGVEPVLISLMLKKTGKRQMSDRDLNNWIRQQINKALKKQAGGAVGPAAGSAAVDFLENLINPPFPSKPSNKQGPLPAKEPIPKDPPYDYTPGQIMSGEAAKRFLRSTGAWEKLKGLKKGDSWDDKIRVMEGKSGKTPVTDFSIPWKDDGTVDMENIVFIMPGVPPGTPPPPGPDQVPDEDDTGVEKDNEKWDEEEKKDPLEISDPEEEKKPPTPKENLERYLQEKKEADKKLAELAAKAKKLAEELVKKEREWTLTRHKGASDAIIDLLDIMQDLIKSPSFMNTDKKWQAYVKDLIKNILKEGVSLTDRAIYYPGTFWEDLKWRPLLEALGGDLFGPLGGYSFWDVVSLPGQVVDHVTNPSKFIEDMVKYVKFIPGGALKQGIQNLLESSGGKLKTVSNIYGPGETLLKQIRDGQETMREVEAVHKEMTAIGDKLSGIKSETIDREFDRDVAELGVKRAQKDVQEWNKLFPRQAQKR